MFWDKVKKAAEERDNNRGIKLTYSGDPRRKSDSYPEFLDKILTNAEKRGIGPVPLDREAVLASGVYFNDDASGQQIKNAGVEYDGEIMCVSSMKYDPKGTLRTKDSFLFRNGKYSYWSFQDNFRLGLEQGAPLEEYEKVMDKHGYPRPIVYEVDEWGIANRRTTNEGTVVPFQRFPEPQPGNDVEVYKWLEGKARRE